MSKKKVVTPKTSEVPYLTFDPNDTAAASKALSSHADFFDGENFVQRSQANLGLSDILPNQSVRKQFTQRDYDSFRPAEALPRNFKEVILAVQKIYKNVGVIKTSIDLMSDFACEGLRFEHSKRNQQQWYNAWSIRINLQNVVHNFMLNLLRDGNVVIRRTTAKITVKQNKKLMKGQAKPDIKIEKDTKNVLQREIPWRYLFISPAVVTIEGGAVGEFINKTLLSIEIPRNLITMVKNPKNDIQKEIIKELPEDVLKAINAGEKKVLLDMTKVSVIHYKKADWEQWATPLLFPVLSDVMFKDKMRLADLAALDGIINVIRIWKLGDHNAKPPILPKKAAVNKLIGILKSNFGGIDLVWDSMIDLQVEYPPIKDILGSEKYEQVDKDIMTGLGIPDILLGGEGSNFSNAFLQLKALTERLEYIRNRTLEWLRKEIKLIMEAQGWKTPPHIVFERTNLKDEMAQKQLLIQMFDRNLLSMETIQKEFGTDFIVELERSRREQNVREENPGLIVDQGPFVKDPALTDTDTPPNPEDNGRPPNTPDIKKRERKNINPRGDLCDLLLTADQLQGTIDLEVDKIYLKRVGIKNIKSLKADQKVALEDTKTYLLFNCSIDTIIGLKYIEEVLQTPTDFYKKIVDKYKMQLNIFFVKNKREPKLGENKKIKSFAWAEINNER